MEQQNDYQYIKVPINLFYLMDANCSKVFITLVQMDSFYPKNEDGYFECAYKTLELACGMSRPVIKASLAGLYLEGILDVISVGQGKGKHTNRYKVNVDKFKDYEKTLVGIAIMTEDKPIHQARYKGERFQVPWDEKRTEKQSEKRTEKQSEKKVTTNIDNIPNVKNIDNTIENKLSKEIKNESQKVNTCNEEKLPTCTIDIVEEEKSFKEFEEESLQDMRDSFNIYCSKIKLDDEMRDKGYECCEDFYERNQTLDYQLLLRNSQQFLEDNDFKLTMLTQRIFLTTGITFTKRVATELLKEYVVGKPA